MYTNANFWRDMAILAGAWIMAGAGYLMMQDTETGSGYGGCDPRYC